MRGRTFATAAIAVVLAMSTAHAHPLTSPYQPVRGDTYCVVDTATMNDTSNNDGISSGKAKSFMSNCSDKLYRNAQAIGVRLRVFWSATSTGDQYLCWQAPGFVYNTQVTAALNAVYEFGRTPPCGQGWYTTEANGWVYVGGQWRGRVVVSPRHLVN